MAASLPYRLGLSVLLPQKRLFTEYRLNTPKIAKQHRKRTHTHTHNILDIFHGTLRSDFKIKSQIPFGRIFSGL